VTGPHPDGSWDACETIAVYAFDGMVTVEVLQVDSDVTLRDLDATDISTVFVDADAERRLLPTLRELSRSLRAAFDSKSG
jgi:hypothetical protein